MKVKIRLAQDSEVKKLLALPDDKAEVMDRCMASSSMVWVGLVDGELACAWGIVPPSFLSNQAYLWLYTTELVREHAFVMVRHSQRFVEELLEQYDVILGHCVLGTPYNIKWLKWLGATFGEPEGRLLPFTIRKKEHG